MIIDIKRLNFRAYTNICCVAESLANACATSRRQAARVRLKAIETLVSNVDSRRCDVQTGTYVLVKVSEKIAPKRYYNEYKKIVLVEVENVTPTRVYYNTGQWCYIKDIVAVIY